jgi:4a-hydroxytetrahydrobiopterin dehydratase
MEIPGWKIENGRLCKTFHFNNFSAAWAFMSRVALLAEKMDHHPNWSNVYGEVHIALYTHSAGQVTDLDRAFAKAVEELASP